MTCREATNLVPLFLDGELDSRQMRAVALHGTRCPSCETELRELERLQELVSENISARVDEVDFSEFWTGVERRLGTIQVSWWRRWSASWSDGDRGWTMRWPVFAAAAAAIAVLAFFFLVRAPQLTTQPDAARLAAVDNAATIDSLDADADSVAVLSDPETRTTVLWVSEDGPVSGDPSE